MNNKWNFTAVHTGIHENVSRDILKYNVTPETLFPFSMFGYVWIELDEYVELLK